MINLVVRRSAQCHNSKGELSDIAKTYKIAYLADRVTMEQEGGDFVIRKIGIPGTYTDITLDPRPCHGQVLTMFKRCMDNLDERDLMIISSIENAWNTAY